MITTISYTYSAVVEIWRMTSHNSLDYRPPAPEAMALPGKLRSHDLLRHRSWHPAPTLQLAKTIGGGSPPSPKKANHFVIYG